jgi:hypothetical protein
VAKRGIAFYVPPLSFTPFSGISDVLLSFGGGKAKIFIWFPFGGGGIGQIFDKGRRLTID